MRKLIAGLMLACCAGAQATGQAVASAPAQAAVTARPFNAADAQLAITALAGSLEENFVGPETGKAYAHALRAKLAAGRYSSFDSAAAFAKAVTADLQAVWPDGHLRFFSSEAAGRFREAPSNAAGEEPESFIEKSGWIAPGVAYISFLAFMGDERSMQGVRDFLASHSSARALIIDARNHHGGGLDEMDLIFAQIFDKPVELLTMDTRAAIDARQGSEFGDLAS